MFVAAAVASCLVCCVYVQVNQWRYSLRVTSRRHLTDLAGLLLHTLLRCFKLHTAAVTD